MDECPLFLAGKGLVADSGPAASAGLQAACVSAKREPTAKTAKTALLELPVVDELRVFPSNFDAVCRDAFLRVPDEALPQKECKGRLNYTVRYGVSSFEVQLMTKAFVVKKNAFGEDVKRSETFSPVCSWIAMNGPDAAWEEAKRKAQQKMPSGL